MFSPHPVLSLLLKPLFYCGVCGLHLVLLFLMWSKVPEAVMIGTSVSEKGLCGCMYEVMGLFLYNHQLLDRKHCHSYVLESLSKAQKSSLATRFNQTGDHDILFILTAWLN